MKCPNCDFVEADEAFGTPPKCPNCGAFYDKALRAKLLKDGAGVQTKYVEPVDAAPVKSRLSNASESVREGRKQRAVAESKYDQTKISRSVIVTDIDMPFWSLVMFMVKFVLASVPAALIVFLIAAGVPSFIGALITILG